MKSSSDSYLSIVAPQQHTWTNEERELKLSLEAISLFRVAQALPLILAVMSLYRSKVISLASAKRTLQLIEKFTFQFNAITGSRGGGGVSNMYAKLAQQASACEDAQDFADVFKDIRAKLVERVPIEIEFEIGFQKYLYLSGVTRDRAFMRYVLRKFSEHFGLPKEVDGNQLTIEHVAPLSQWTKYGEDAIGSFGNLILVPTDVNKELGTKTYLDKVDILKKHQTPSDEYLISQKNWGVAEISERNGILAKLAYNTIWKL